MVSAFFGGLVLGFLENIFRKSFKRGASILTILAYTLFLLNSVPVSRVLILIYIMALYLLFKGKSEKNAFGYKILIRQK